ncbi:MAG: hypothetical protein KGP28_09975 [Bdellovibrionales bacterium]|nr:hypothetical protein [Bdellovibrionales bacterium]
MKGWIAWIVACVAFGTTGVAISAQRVDPGSRGVFVENRDGRFFKVSKSRFGGYELVPIQLTQIHATPGGLTLYPASLNETYHNVFEYNPVSGEYLGPANLQSLWDGKTRTYKVAFFNGFERRPVMELRAPGILQDLTGAVSDLSRNVFWIQETLTKGIRIFHDHAELNKVPLNELVFGEKILKVLPSDTGEGILVLLESGQALRVRIRDDFALEVSRLNRLSDFRVFDLEVGPLGDDPFRFSAVLFGMAVDDGVAGVRVLDQRKLVPVPLRYLDPMNRVHEFNMVLSLTGNIHDVPLQKLVDRHPSELNRLNQANFELRQDEIRMRLRYSNSDEPLKEKITRKVTYDPKAPGLCRFYLLKNFGLSPDLYLN